MKQLYSRSARFYMLTLVLMLLSAPTLFAQPIYNQKNVTQTSWTVFNLSKTFRALAYSTDPAGQNKQIRLGSLKESGLPPIEIVAMNANFEPSHFIFNNNKGKYECANPLFTSEDGVSVLWGWHWQA